MILNIIIKEIDEHKELSYWEIYKILRDKYKLKCEKSNIRYHLEKLRKQGFIGKNGSKYFLVAPTICIDGVVLFTSPPAVVNCPFFNDCNKCSFGEKCCMLFNSLPKELQDYFKKIVGERD